MYRKGVSALIVNSRDEFLLVNLESFALHFFAVPGGGIEPDETLEDGVYREIEEELGIKKYHLQFIGKSNKPLSFAFKTKKLYRDGTLYDGSERYFYGFSFVGDEKEIRVQTGEVRSYVWVKYEDLKNYLLFEDQLSDTTEKIKEIFYKGNMIVQ